MIDSSGTMPGVRRGADDQASAGETFADIIVGIAVKLEGDAAGKPGAEALPRRAGEADVDGVVRQAFGNKRLATSPGEHAPQARSVLRMTV